MSQEAPKNEVIDIEVIDQDKTLNELTKFSVTEAVLSDLESRYTETKDGVVGPKRYDLSTNKGLAEAIKGRAELREWRVGLEKDKNKKAEPINKAHKYLLSEFKRIYARIWTLEEPIDKDIREAQEKKEIEKKARDEAEAARVAAIQSKIDLFRNAILGLSGKPSAYIQAELDKGHGLVLGESEFEEFLPVAQVTLQISLDAIKVLLEETIAREAEEARIGAERIALEKAKLEQSIREAKAEKERIEAEAEAKRKIEEEERKARVAREAEEKRIREVRESEENRIRELREADKRKLAQEETWIKNVQQLRDIPYKINPSTTSSEDISDTIQNLTKNKNTILTTEAYGTYLKEATESLGRVLKALDDLHAKAVEREAQETKAKADKDEADRRHREQMMIEEEQARRQAELDQQERDRKEKERLAAERRRKLAGARRDTPVSALLEILELAQNVEGYPDDHEVRETIGIIAESNLLDEKELPEKSNVVTLPKRRGRKPKAGQG